MDVQPVKGATMARIRTIKPEFWSDSKTGTLSDKATKLFIGMLNFCDDYGVIDYNIPELSAKIFPFENFIEHSKELLDVFVNELFPKGLVSMFSYSEDDENVKSYLWIKNFEKHQKVDKPGKPLIINWIKGDSPLVFAKRHGIDFDELDIKKVDDIRGAVAKIREASPNTRENSRGFGENSIDNDCNDLKAIRENSRGLAKIRPGREGKGRERKGKEKNTEPSGSVCTTPEKPGVMPAIGVPIISIPLICKKDGHILEQPIYQPSIDEWIGAYPAVDVMQELRNIRQWNLANPSRRKTKTGIMRHINTWLSKEQDRGGNEKNHAGPGQNQISTGDRNTDRTLTNAVNWVRKKQEAGERNESK